MIPTNYLAQLTTLQTFHLNTMKNTLGKIGLIDIGSIVKSNQGLFNKFELTSQSWDVAEFLVPFDNFSRLFDTGHSF